MARLGQERVSARSGLGGENVAHRLCGAYLLEMVFATCSCSKPIVVPGCRELIGRACRRSI